MSNVRAYAHLKMWWHLFFHHGYRSPSLCTRLFLEWVTGESYNFVGLHLRPVKMASQPLGFYMWWGCSVLVVVVLIQLCDSFTKWLLAHSLSSHFINVLLVRMILAIHIRWIWDRFGHLCNRNDVCIFISAVLRPDREHWMGLRRQWPQGSWMNLSLREGWLSLTASNAASRKVL